MSRSRGSIRALLAAKPDKAVIKTSDGYHEVRPESVEVGDLILIKPGEKIPLDGLIPTGNSQLDSSALTGEFVPVSAKPGDTVLAGQINKGIFILFGAMGLATIWQAVFADMGTDLIAVANSTRMIGIMT